MQFSKNIYAKTPQREHNIQSEIHLSENWFRLISEKHLRTNRLTENSIK